MRLGHYSRKKANRGRGGGLRIWTFQGLIKNEVEFPRVKQKNGKFQGWFQKSMSSTPLPSCLWFFSGIFHCWLVVCNFADSS